MTVVVGAAAVDVVARRERFLAGTSNPAAIRWAAGGVGYRIWRRLPSPSSCSRPWATTRLATGWGKRIGAVRAGQAAGPAARRPRERSPASAALRHGLLLRVYGLRSAAVRRGGYGSDRAGPHPGAPAAAPAAAGPGRPAGAGGQPLPGAGARAPAPLRRVHPRGVRRRVRGKAPAPRTGLRDLFLLCANREEVAALRARVAPGARGEQWVARFLREQAHRPPAGPARAAWGAPARPGSGRAGPLRELRSGARGARGRQHRRRRPPAGRGVVARRPRFSRPADRAEEIAAVLPAAMREVEKALEEGTL